MICTLFLSLAKGTATEWAARAHRMFLKLPSSKFLEEFDFRFYVDSLRIRLNIAAASY